MTEQDPPPNGASSQAGDSSPVAGQETQATAAKGDLEPRWLVIAGLLAVTLLALLLWWRPAEQPPAPAAPAAATDAGQVSALATEKPAATAAVAPAALLLPTSTPMPKATRVLPTATPTSLVLPTATPTALPPALLQRSLDVSGRISLTLTLESASFQSDGRPLRLGVERRTYLLNPENPTAEEHWCQQLGVVHLRGHLRYALDLNTGDVRAIGSLKLISDFCDAPGDVQFIAPVSLLFPADTVTPVAIELSLSRRLFERPDLLDSQAAVGLELTVINSLAEQ